MERCNGHEDEVIIGIGSLVRLASGGQVMIVSDISVSKRVHCQWHDGYGLPQSRWYPAILLTEATYADTH